MKTVGLLCIAMLFLCGAAYAKRTVWYVHPDSALNTIQAGLDSCADNDIVLVGPGTYTENIVWPNTQGIGLISEYGADTTIIDGDSLGRVITLSTSVDTTTKIRGFTIKNGFSDEYGGGIFCDGCSPSITCNNINDNRGNNLGGGIACYGSDASPIIDSNTICNNTCCGVPTWPPACGGAGIGIRGGHTSITRNIITNNYAEHCGGGILYSAIWDTSSAAILRDNDIQGNTADYCGAAIYCEGCSTIVSNCSINSNTSNCDGGALGIWGQQFVFVDSCAITENTGIGVWISSLSLPEITLAHCDIFSNTSYGMYNEYSNVTVNAEYNWWGDSTGPYHPDSNPGGLGDTVSDYVDFDPWLYWPVGVEERPIVSPVEKQETITTTIFRGPLQLPDGKQCKVFDITGRVVEPGKMQPGIYFIEVDGVVTQKVVKVR